ncbi:AAA family ATPase [Marinicrinis sediminis]|uniref:AAA family ATPase n=1 Tax=Marinicrinis sediminis TaxID=1652465 RepID=A0ABW5REL3_9BACL
MERSVEKDWPLAEAPRELLERVINRVQQRFAGKRELIEKCMLSFVSGGHVLLEDVPGVGKTLLAQTIANALDMDFHRVQCTPDVMPADLTGYPIYHQPSHRFEFQKGPLHCNLLLADELNRTTPRTQSALLEAMGEGSISVDGTQMPLPVPFLVIATQNPSSFEGTYPLPEAQLDRFMMKLSLGYPDPDSEVRMLDQTDRLAERARQKRPILFREEFVQLMKQRAKVYVDPALKSYMVALVTQTRQHADISLGASPRATVQLLQCAQARAMLAGRSYAIPDDIRAMAPHVLAHRMVWHTRHAYTHQEAVAWMSELVHAIPVPVFSASGVRSNRDVKQRVPG